MSSGKYEEHRSLSIFRITQAIKYFVVLFENVQKVGVTKDWIGGMAEGDVEPAVTF